uniref:Uncharacterized protein n=1 Tax=Vespula pensylvanica TaxID=30213 RepID=A0A834P7C6_VESPE|nr:hypothetical protein H0235_004361 [Vespula pensylvanica]
MSSDRTNLGQSKSIVEMETCSANVAKSKVIVMQPPTVIRYQALSKTHNLSIREAINIIPDDQYDGYNISLSIFMRAYKWARELIPDDIEETITKLIITRLRPSEHSRK